MNPIRNPFSRDEHPDLTAAILGVVNETHSRKTLEGLSTTALRKLRKEYQKGVAKGHKDAARELADIHGILRSRGAGAALDEDLQTPERAAEMGARKKKAAQHSADAMKRNPEGAGTAAIVNSEIDLRIKDKRERDSKKTYGKGGKVVRESASPQGGDKKPSNPFNPTLGDLLRSKQQDKKAPKGKPVKEDIQTPSRERQMSKQIGKHTKTFMSAMNNYQIQVHKGPKATDAAEKKWTAATDKLTATQAKDADEKRSRKTYGTGGKVVREAVTAAQQKVFARERERMLNALNNPKQKLSPTEREAVLARGARNAAAETRKDAVSPTGEKSPIHSAAKAHHEYARRESKKLDAIAKRKVHEDIQTPERAEQQRKRIKSAERGVIFGSRYGRADRTGRLRQLQRIDAREKADTKTTWGVSEPHHIRGHDESTPRKTRERKVQEGAQLDERIIDEVDFFQASKNLLTGKGFKTNREVSGARVNANMAAMQRRKARATKKTK